MNRLVRIFAILAGWCGQCLPGLTHSLTPTICSITWTLVSRILLELQEANRTVIRVDADDPLNFPRGTHTYDTPSFIATFGGFVSPDLVAPPDDDCNTEWHVGSRSDEKEDEEGKAQDCESHIVASEWSSTAESVSYHPIPTVKARHRYLAILFVTFFFSL